MASVQEVLAINSRPGDSIKGGSQTFGITLDTSPFNRLAEYTYLDNVQKQKDKVAKDQQIATEMGAALALDPNATNKELYEALNKKKEEINYLIKNNKDVFDYNKNPAANAKLKELMSEFSSNRAKATAFDLLNNAAVTEIAKISDPQEQQSAREVLENNRKIVLAKGADEFFRTGTQLETGLVNFKAEDFKVPKVGKLSYTTSTIGGDNNFSKEVNVLDINAAKAQAEQVWLGIQSETFTPEPNPNDDTVIALRNRNLQLQNSAKNAKKGRFSEQTLQKMNTVIEEYKLKIAEWEKTKTGPEPKKTDQMLAIDAINENILAANAALGVARSKNPNLKVPSFEIINYEDGLSGPELVLMETLANQSADKFVEYVDKATNTGNATTRRGQDIAASTADKNRAAANARAAVNGGKKPGEPGYMDGNDFDKIQNHKFPTGEQIIDGIFVNKDGSLVTGLVRVPKNKVPKTIFGTIKQLDKEDDYLEEGSFVLFDVVDGVSQAVKTAKGGIVTRNNQIAGQRNFDKRTKQETQQAFGGEDEEINEDFAQ